jgi:ABC-type multidrug transport system ATPase subunit
VLNVEQVCKWLGGRRVVDDVSFDCVGGDAVAVMGPNGAGKSTLLAMLGGVLAPDKGAIIIDGHSIVGRRARSRHRLGYVPEAANPPAHLRVSELLRLVSALKAAPVLDETMQERLGIDEVAHQRIGSLSLGERRRACLGAALTGAPALLVLDEPTNGLDDAGVVELASVLVERRDAGVAIIVATHDATFAASLDAKTLRLRAGRVVDDA